MTLFLIQILKEGLKTDNISEVAKLFDLHDDWSCDDSSDSHPHVEGPGCVEVARSTLHKRPNVSLYMDFFSKK